MQDTTKTIGKLYIAGGIWFLAMISAALVAHLSMTAFYWAIDASAAVQVLTTMTIAVAVATSVVRIGWVRLVSTAPSTEVVEQRVVDTDGAEGALVAAR